MRQKNLQELKVMDSNGYKLLLHRIYFKLLSLLIFMPYKLIYNIDLLTIITIFPESWGRISQHYLDHSLNYVVLHDDN